MQSITFPAWLNSKDNSAKRSRLQFGYARIRSAICGSVNLILTVGFIGHAHPAVVQPIACFFVASTAPSDLLFRAKHLFVAPDCHGCSQLRPSADAITATLAPAGRTPT